LRFLEISQPIISDEIHSFRNIESMRKCRMKGFRKSYDEFSGFLMGFENGNLEKLQN